MSQQLSNSTYIIIHLFINLFCWNQECHRRQNGYWILPRVVHFALHPQKRDGLLGTGTGGGRGRKNEGSTADTARKRQERPWTAARTVEMLRRYPLAIAQRLVHYAIAVSTAVLGKSHKEWRTMTMSVALLLRNKSKRKKSNFRSPAPPPYSWSLLGKLKGPAPPPSSRSFDLAWNLVCPEMVDKYLSIHSHCTLVKLVTARSNIVTSYICIHNVVGPQTDIIIYIIHVISEAAWYKLHTGASTNMRYWHTHWLIEIIYTNTGAAPVLYFYSGSL